MKNDLAPVYRLVPSRVLAWLCHYANSDPISREVFYSLKRRLLLQFGVLQSIETQEIVKYCWGDHRDEWGDWYGCGPKCQRCGGSGVYCRRWVSLERWKWEQYVFYVPAGTTRVKPDTVQIHGRIQHADNGRASREAELWLYLATFHWAAWWRLLSTCCYLRPGWWPMCRLQKIAMRARHAARMPGLISIGSAALLTRSPGMNKRTMQPRS